MKADLLSTTVSLILTLFVAAPARAAMIAGWDFSQFFASGELSVDTDDGYTDVVGANYSNLLGGRGLGPGAAAHGALFFNGDFGSTDVVEDSPTAQLTPRSDSLEANVNAPLAPGEGFDPFGSYNSLAAAGQIYTEDLSLQIQNTVSFVFAAYLDAVPGLGSDWSISFGGRTQSGESLIAVEFSTDGSSFTSVGTRTLDSGDSPFTVLLPGSPSETAFVRFNVTMGNGVAPRIDNVAINATVVAPEPATIVLLGSAAAGFAILRHRRRR